MHCLRVIDRARAEGRSAEATIRQIARQRRNKTYKCDPRRKLRLSRTTLHRIWYRWLRSRCNPSAFELHYASGRRELTRHERAIVRRHLLNARAVSFLAVHRAMVAAGEWTESYDTLLRATPKTWRKQMRPLFRARQKQHHIEQRFARLLNGKGATA